MTVPDISQLIQFLLKLDFLKSVERKNYISGGYRHENSAEHSWHLAMACWAFNQHFDLKLSEEKLIKLALVHDLGEIDAGRARNGELPRKQITKSGRQAFTLYAQHKK